VAKAVEEKIMEHVGLAKKEKEGANP
jgi:hypothetical protein